MLKRPTIGLCLIVKNEEHNLPILLDSIKGCFDEIYVTDTGSTDQTVPIALERGCTVSFFDWVHDFAAARNYNFSQAKTDYTMWMDADDSLINPQDFIKWRDHAMRFNDYVYAAYDYASDDNGNPIVSFVRERVIKNGLGLRWNYFVHEGIMPNVPNLACDYSTTWKIKHRRSLKDIQQDKGRNLAIFEKHKSNLDSRMKFYYGKELFENRKLLEAFPVLIDAISQPDLELHDRILGIQYACFTAIETNQFEKCIHLAHQGLQLDPNRAEFHVFIGDCYIKLNNPYGAIPFYNAAKKCTKPGNEKYVGAVFCYDASYNVHPRLNLARVYYSLGLFEKALYEAEENTKEFPTEESKYIVKECKAAIDGCYIKSPDELIKVDDIIISTPAHAAFLWDTKVYKEQGIGGSETAAIELARWLKIKTGRNIIIFNDRPDTYIDDLGVEFRPVRELLNYTTKYLPYKHIAWRHNSKLTSAETYLWCHDLVTQGCEVSQNFDKIICLSEFHKNYVMAKQGIREDKIILGRNGIDPERFKLNVDKIPSKVMFPSSPDRGLDRAMLIMDKVREEIPDAELHVFYGIEHLDKYGLKELRLKIESMMKDRPWVKYHGKTQQDELSKQFMESTVWLYPAEFIESFCISAIEAISARCYPIVRNLGALPDTLKDPISRGMADLLDIGSSTEDDQKVWADHVVSAIKEEKWKNIDISPEVYSWESVTDDFIKFMNIDLDAIDLKDGKQYIYGH